MSRNGLLLAVTLAIILAVGVSMPYGISYSDGPQLSDKSALAAEKKKKKNKIKRSGQTQGRGGELANLLGQRVAAGRDRLRKQVAKGGGLGSPAIYF